MRSKLLSMNGFSTAANGVRRVGTCDIVKSDALVAVARKMIINAKFNNTNKPCKPAGSVEGDN